MLCCVDIDSVLNVVIHCTIILMSPYLMSRNKSVYYNILITTFINFLLSVPLSFYLLIVVSSKNELFQTQVDYTFQEILLTTFFTVSLMQSCRYHFCFFFFVGCAEDLGFFTWFTWSIFIFFTYLFIRLPHL